MYMFSLLYICQNGMVTELVVVTCFDPRVRFGVCRTINRVTGGEWYTSEPQSYLFTVATVPNTCTCNEQEKKPPESWHSLSSASEIPHATLRPDNISVSFRPIDGHSR